MITGYNTDIKHLDTVFHVQTEDKGTSNPYIESLIYVGGQILAAKRQKYGELLEEGKGEEDIVKMMEQQHRTMLAAIRAGRFDEKLATVVPSHARKETQTAAIEQEPPEEEAGPEQTLDQVILNYLASEAEQEHLVLAIEGEAQIRAGASVDVSLRASSSRSGDAVGGAQVVAKMISTVSQPLTLGLGETDDEGKVALHLEIPRLEGGAAAMIITAASRIGRAEIKRLL